MTPQPDKQAENTQDVVPPGTAPNTQDGPLEIGGRKGPDPARYGDWEKDGKCVDF